MESAAVLELPVLMAAGAVELRKTEKANLATQVARLAGTVGRYDQLTGTKTLAKQRAFDWQTRKTQSVEQLRTSIAAFEVERQCQVARLLSEQEFEQSQRQAFESRRAETITELREKDAGFEQEKSAKVDAIIARLEAMDKLIRPPEEFDARLTECRSQLTRLGDLRRQVRATQTELAGKRAALDSLAQEKQRLHNHGSICPMCLGPSDNANKQARLAELDALTAPLSAEVDKLARSMRALDELMAAEPKMQADYDAAVQAKANNKSYIDRFEADKELFERVQASASPYTSLVEVENAKANPYDKVLEARMRQLEAAKTSVSPAVAQLEAEQAKVNPFEGQLTEFDTELAELAATVSEARASVSRSEHRVASLSQVYDLSFSLRGELLRKTVLELENSTNKYLEDYFDSVIRVTFLLEDADKLEVELQKSGHKCTFRQLSGGQRCMLKLAFGVSLMAAVQNKSGVHFSTLIFDEALNGLDPALKVQVFRMFEGLADEYESVLLIDHEDRFKQMFSKQFRVTLTGDCSEVKEYDGAEDCQTEKALGVG